MTLQVTSLLGSRENAADGGMIAESIDFSYIGVSGIWNNDLGKNHHNA